MYNIINYNSHTHFNNRISDIKRNIYYPTRFITNNNLDLPLYTLTKCQRSFLYRGIGFWNSLPIELKNITTSYKFKRNLKQYLLH